MFVRLVLTAALAAVFSAAASAQAPRAVLATEVAQCERSVGPEAPVAAATDYPGGISKSGNGLTPATVPGATTVSPKVAACLSNNLANELVVIQVVSDPNGIGDAYVLPFGSTRELTPAESAIVKSSLDMATGGSKDLVVLVYCHHTSCMLSYNAALRLRELGYNKVLWMREGIKGWKEAGLPVGLVRTPEGKVKRTDVTLSAKPVEYFPVYPRPPEGVLRQRREAAGQAPLTGMKLCAYVRAKVHDEQARQPKYRSALYAAAGVDTAKDHDGVIRRKMQAYWKRYGDLYECFESSKQVRGGKSIIRTAVLSNNTDFLVDVADNWKLPLNKVDSEDGRTALDSAQVQYSVNPDKAIQAMYNLLRHAGALHRQELEERGLWKRQTALQAEYMPLHKLAAERGDIESMWYLFYTYMGGNSTAADRNEAMRWFAQVQQRAIETNALDQMATIGYKYMDRTEFKSEIAPDARQAYAWMKRAADGGSSTGKLWTGRHLLYGTGVARNEAAGLAMLRQVFVESHDGPDEGPAVVSLGRYYEDIGDRQTAATWLRWAPSGMTFREGMSVSDWFDKTGVNPCGPFAPGKPVRVAC